MQINGPTGSILAFREKSFYSLLDWGGGLFCFCLGRKQIYRAPPKRTTGCIFLTTEDVSLIRDSQFLICRGWESLQLPDTGHAEASPATQFRTPSGHTDPQNWAPSSHHSNSTLGTPKAPTDPQLGTWEPPEPRHKDYGNFTKNLMQGMWRPTQVLAQSTQGFL